MDIDHKPADLKAIYADLALGHSKNLLMPTATEVRKQYDRKRIVELADELMSMLESEYHGTR